MKIKIGVIQELIKVTNSINHRYVSSAESNKVIELNELLLNLQDNYVKSRTKKIEGFGGVADASGIYRDITDKAALSAALLELSEIEYEIKRNTHILSQDSYDALRAEVDFNTIHLKLFREHLLVKPDNTENKKA